MAAIGKIPPALHALVLKLAGEGKSSEEIAAQLWLEHRCETSSRAVRRLLQRDRSERADVAKSVVREEIRQYLIASVQRIERVAARAVALERRARTRAEAIRTQPDGHPWHPLALKEDALALKAMAEVRKSAYVLLHLAGLNQADAPDAKKTVDVDARAALLDKIRKLIETPKPPEPEPVH